MQSKRYLPESVWPESVWLWRGFDACYTLAVSFIDSAARVCKQAALPKVSHAN